MAVIAVDGQRSWVVARWAVRYVLDQVNLSEIDAMLAEQIRQVSEYDAGYLDLKNSSLDNKLLFSLQVRRIADSLEQAESNFLSTPSIYDDLVSGLRELQCLIEASASDLTNVSC